MRPSFQPIKMMMVHALNLMGKPMVFSYQSSEKRVPVKEPEDSTSRGPLRPLRSPLKFAKDGHFMPWVSIKKSPFCRKNWDEPQKLMGLTMVCNGIEWDIEPTV